MKNLIRAEEFEARWFKQPTRHLSTGDLMINERAVRARAGIMLLMSAVLLYTRLDHGHHMEMVLAVDALSDAMQGHSHSSHIGQDDLHDAQKAMVNSELKPRVYSHTHVFFLLGVIIYEMLMPIFRQTAKFSITARLGTWLTRKQKPNYVPMRPKTVAWSMGLIMATTCLGLVYAFVVTGFMSPLPLILLVMCFSFMWLEATANICVVCVAYNWLANKKIINVPCEACNMARE